MQDAKRRLSASPRPYRIHFGQAVAAGLALTAPAAAPHAAASGATTPVSAAPASRTRLLTRGLAGGSTQSTRRHGADGVADLRALALGFDVRYEVFLAEEVDAQARMRLVGYEIELRGEARPLLSAWFGDDEAAAQVRDALERLAEAASRGPCVVARCAPTLGARRREGLDPAPERLRVCLYEHAHPLDAADVDGQPCVRAVSERLAALGVRRAVA
ncbi:MAG: hypothetical protein HY908_25820 [Myxococcales bacterium]|nr:hypothetical protein [Myxococcales bacterium]